jgi:hypothetical protein
MCEGWLIQEGMVFMSQYLHEANSSLPQPVSISHSISVIDLKVIDGPTILSQGMGRSVSLRRELRSKLKGFCILNMQVMRPWVEKYHEAYQSIEHERTHIRRKHDQCALVLGHII